MKAVAILGIIAAVALLVFLAIAFKMANVEDSEWHDDDESDS